MAQETLNLLQQVYMLPLIEQQWLIQQMQENIAYNNLMQVQPLTWEDVNRRVAESERQIKNGEVCSTSDVLKRLERIAL